METYKVLLIDDEPIIIEGLKILIDWAEYRCEIVGSASDGLEGLHLIEKKKPDIVISDINMPNFSGIEMISQSLSIHPCKFIILSGYSDFSYAKQCISLGVQEYLLKPIEVEQLIQSLQKIQEQLKNEKETKQSLSFLKDAKQQLSFLAQDDTLRDIMNSYYESEYDFINMLKNFDIPLQPCDYYIAAAFQFPTEFTSLDLRSLLDRELKVITNNFLLFYNGNNTYLCILGTTHCLSLEEMQAMHKLLNQTLSFDVCIGIGKDYNEMHMLPLSCKQAVFALSYKTIRGFHSVNPFLNDLKQAHFILTIPNELWNNYYMSLQQPNFSNISASIQKIFYYMQKICNMPILGIQINSMNLIMNCLQHFTDEYDLFTSSSYNNVDFIQHISTITNAEELEKYVMNVVYSILNKRPELEIKKPNHIISQIENYINSHYLEDLSLITISQMFYISPIYLSQAFKKQTGQLYLDYVTQVKMNAAKKMLMSTDMMVYEIAEKLHYKDSKYFSRLFEKKIGKKPSEYRKNL
jgi:two-component system, response regulator YesN